MSSTTSQLQLLLLLIFYVNFFFAKLCAPFILEIDEREKKSILQSIFYFNRAKQFFLGPTMPDTKVWKIEQQSCICIEVTLRRNYVTFINITQKSWVIKVWTKKLFLINWNLHKKFCFVASFVLRCFKKSFVEKNH